MAQWEMALAAKSDNFQFPPWNLYGWRREMNPTSCPMPFNVHKNTAHKRVCVCVCETLGVFLSHLLLYFFFFETASPLKLELTCGLIRPISSKNPPVLYLTLLICLPVLGPWPFHYDTQLVLWVPRILVCVANILPTDPLFRGWLELC